jgi:hypothetical protein
MFVPQGEIKTVGGRRLQTEVQVLPDVPSGRFQLTLSGVMCGGLQTPETSAAARWWRRSNTALKREEVGRDYGGEEGLCWKGTGAPLNC